MPDPLRDRIAEALHSVTWPDGSTDDLPTRSVCRMLAAALLPLVEQYGAERVAEVERERDAAEAVALVTPCACSAQRARAEAAEATLREVRALGDEWASELDSGAIRDPKARYCWQIATRELRAVLDDEGGEPHA